jgi:hypothetical protein
MQKRGLFTRNYVNYSLGLPRYVLLQKGGHSLTKDEKTGVPPRPKKSISTLLSSPITDM